MMIDAFPLVPISALVTQIDTWRPQNAIENELINYIDIGSIDQTLKQIDNVNKIRAHHAPSRARQIVEGGDILVSTVRPNLNAVAEVPTEFNGYIASTGFCVLRALKEKLLPRYLYHWVRTHHFIDNMTSLATGASYPAVSDRIVKNSLILLPSLEKQKRIAAILDKADAIRQRRQESIRLTEEFLRSTFLEMFGDPVMNPKAWEIVRLKEVTSKIGSGATPRGGENSYVNQGISLIRSLNVHDDALIYRNLAHITSTQAEELFNVTMEASDVLLNITGASVCRCCIVPVSVLPARVNQHVCIIRPNKEKLTSEYLLHCLISSGYKDKLLSIAGAGGATREALTKQQIENIEIPLPPIELQSNFTLIKNYMQALKSKYVTFVENPLFDSLTQCAFRGELL